MASAVRPRAAKAFVSQLADVARTATVGAGSVVDAFARVGANASVGRGAAVAGHAVVGNGATLGAGVQVDAYAVVGSGATLMDGCVVGARGVVEPGATVPAFAVVEPGGRVSKSASPSARRAPQDATATVALTEALAAHYAEEWALTPSQRLADVEARHDRATYTAQGVLEAQPGHWETFVNSNPNPIKHPERRGLIFNKS